MLNLIFAGNNMEATLLKISDLQSYRLDKFLADQPETGIFYSPKYLSLLEKLTEANHYVLAVIKDEEICGIFPFLEKKGAFGTVINSMPFYGSHGGAICINKETETALIKGFVDYCELNKVLSATIIPAFTNPNMQLYFDSFSPDFQDLRIAQFTSLSMSSSSTEENFGESLMNTFHYKTRNMVRKAMKNDIEIRSEISDEMLRFLETTHVANCEAIGVVPKTEAFFNGIKTEFEAGKDYKIYSAWHDGKPIAALLCLYYNKTVEYFVPAIVEEFRSLQPMSCIIFQAMTGAAKEGFQIWNWGGTGPAATGVYRFKSRWGTTNKDYWYFTRIFDKKALEMSREDILNHYRYFYVAPFTNSMEKAS